MLRMKRYLLGLKLLYQVISGLSLVNNEREPRVTPLNARADPFFSMCVCADHFKRCDAVRYLLIVTDVLLIVNDVL